VPKQGEIDYVSRLTPDELRFALDKPFSDAECGRYLMELGALMYLLPAPPARLLDLGCGTGWTSCFFARRGYDVVGQDIAPAMISQAQLNKERYGVPNARFVDCDYEGLPFRDEFDCALFYDSLHHAVSEEQALRGVYRALKPGAVCVTSEPGVGHARRQSSLDAMRKFNVTERDMPPTRIIRVARRIGFRRFRIYPHMKPFGMLLYGKSESGILAKLRWLPYWVRSLALMFYASFYKRFNGLVVLEK